MSEQSAKKDERQSKRYFISESTATKTRYDIYLTGEITDGYFEVLNCLRQAATDDEIHMFINSEGGSLDTALQIINAIDQTPARLVTYIDSRAHSAAALIFLQGQECHVSKNSTMCCHFWSGGAKGRAADVKTYIDFYSNATKKMFRGYLEGFIKEEEFVDLFNGKDFYFDYEEICKRLDDRNSFNIKNSKKIDKPKTKKIKNEEE